MSLFKNGVGRPSNETLRKRKIVIATLVVLVMALVGIGIYFGVSFFNKKDANSTGMNIDPDAKRQEHPQVQITAYNMTTNKIIKTVDNNNLLLSGWVNYKVSFRIGASSKSSKIKSIVLKWNDAGIKTTSSSNYKTLKSSKTYNVSTATLNYTTEGARYGTVTITDAKNRKTTVKIGANIDLTAPVVALAWNKLEKATGSDYYIGAVGQVTCGDAMSGVSKTIAYEAKDDNNKVTAGTKVSLTLKQTGSNYFVGQCFDKAGNIAQKNATKHTYVEGPQIIKVTGNATKWTNKDVVLAVNAKAKLGLNAKAFSFDGGKTWQANASKKFTKNQTVTIVVRDVKGNISVPKTIKITKIDKEKPTISFDYNSTSYTYTKNSKSSVINIVCKDNAGVYVMQAWSNLNTGIEPTGDELFSADLQKITPPKSYTFNYRLNRKGKDKIKVVCGDAVGNRTEVYSKELNVK